VNLRGGLAFAECSACRISVKNLFAQAHQAPLSDGMFHKDARFYQQIVRRTKNVERSRSSRSVGLAIGSFTCHDGWRRLHRLTYWGTSMFTRNSSAEPKPLEPRSTRPAGANGTRPSISAPSSGEKSVIGNDLRIIGQGLKIISRGMLQVDGEIEGDVQAAE